MDKDVTALMLPSQAHLELEFVKNLRKQRDVLQSELTQLILKLKAIDTEDQFWNHHQMVLRKVDDETYHLENVLRKNLALLTRLESCVHEIQPSELQLNETASNLRMKLDKRISAYMSSKTAIELDQTSKRVSEMETMIQTRKNDLAKLEDDYMRTVSVDQTKVNQETK